jgi:hypothetical protein
VNVLADFEKCPVDVRKRLDLLASLLRTCFRRTKSASEVLDFIEQATTLDRRVGGKAVERTGRASILVEPGGLVHPDPERGELRDLFDNQAVLLRLDADGFAFLVRAFQLSDQALDSRVPTSANVNAKI